MARIIIRQGREAGVEYTLEGESFILGRAKDSHIQVLDPKSSRKHAEVFRRGERFYIRDLASANGTVLNGAPLEAEEPLSFGDKIRIGSHLLEFVEDTAMVAAAAPAAAPAAPAAAPPAAAAAEVEVDEPEEALPAPPADSPAMKAAMGGVAVLVALAVGLGVYWMLRKPLARPVEEKQEEPPENVDFKAGIATKILNQAYELAAAGKLNQAEALCNQVLTKYPDQPAAKEARKLLETIKKPDGG